MKRLIAIALVLTFLFILIGCASRQTEIKTGETAPTITIYDKNYVAPYTPIDELPDGYAYIGDLSEEDTNDTGLAGCKMYAIKELNSLSDFYLYQKCAIPIDENTVDSTQQQWMYMQWVLSE